MGRKKVSLSQSLEDLSSLLGIMLVSASALILEIMITRIFSATIYYHYAFVAVSVAVLGWGLGGALSHFLRKKLSWSVVATMTLCASLSIPFYLWAIILLPMSVSLLIFYCMLSTIPFFLGGASVSSVLQILRHQANKVYFADLTGGGLGCLLVDPLLTSLGAETGVLVLGVTMAASGLVFSLLSRKRQLMALSLVVMLSTSIIAFSNMQNGSMTIQNATDKALFQELHRNPELRHVLTKWNSFSRIDVVEGLPYPYLNQLAQIRIDAGAETDVTRWDGDTTNISILSNMSCSMLCYVPYYLVTKPENVLIIGSGGGNDVIYALIAGSSRVTAVEINPIIVNLVRGYGSRAGDVYQRDHVEVVVDDGRNFVSRSNEKFDVEFLTLVDTLAAIYAGGYALSENYLYTVEAFQQYLDHLTDRGVLAVVRFTVDIPELLSIAITAMQYQGLSYAEALRHIAIVIWQKAPGVFLSLFMVKKSPFSYSQAQLVSSQIGAMGSRYTILYLPYFHVQDSSLSSAPRPATDDRPYYFYFLAPGNASLLSLLEFATVVSAACFIVPFLRGRTRSCSSNRSVVLFAIYFTAIGMGFMFLEIPLIQEFILFLGYPTRALTVVLFSLLLSGGLGSFLSGSVRPQRQTRKAIISCSIIAVIASSYYLLLRPVLAALLPQEATVRMVAAIFLIMPLGFFMGIPFPTGIALVSSNSEVSIPWLWVINGSMSVMGSVLATAIGIFQGLSYAIIMSVVFYALALVCVARVRVTVPDQN